MVKRLTIEVESHLTNPGIAEQSLGMLTSHFFGHSKDRRIIYMFQKNLILCLRYDLATIYIDLVLHQN